MSESVKERVIKIISIYVDPWEMSSDVNPEDYIVDDLWCDSLDTIEILMEIENEFQLEIDDEDAEKCLTVQDAIDYVEAALKARSN